MPLVPVMPVSPRRSSGRSIEVAGGEGQSVPAVLHLDPGNAPRRLALARYGDCAAGQGVGRELAAVGAAARESEEQVSLADAPRIVLQAFDRQGGQLRRKGLAQPDTR